MNPETDQHKHAQLNFDKGAKTIQERTCSTKGPGPTGHPQAKKVNLHLGPITYTKMKCKWITDLNVKHKTINFFGGGEYRGKKTFGI